MPVASISTKVSTANHSKPTKTRFIRSASSLPTSLGNFGSEISTTGVPDNMALNNRSSRFCSKHLGLESFATQTSSSQSSPLSSGALGQAHALATATSVSAPDAAENSRISYSDLSAVTPSGKCKTPTISITPSKSTRPRALSPSSKFAICTNSGSNKPGKTPSSRGSNRISSSSSPRESAQRLTNGGIPQVSTPSSPRRHRRMSIGTPAEKSLLDVTEPKSILKNANRRSSISQSEFSDGLIEPTAIAQFYLSKSPSFHSSNEDNCSFHQRNEKIIAFPGIESPLSGPALSEEDILKKCNYRLPTENDKPSFQDLPASKKVTFFDDVVVLRKANKKRRHSVPNLK